MNPVRTCLVILFAFGCASEVGDLKTRIDVDYGSLQGFVLAREEGGAGEAVMEDPLGALYGVTAENKLVPISLTTGEGAHVHRLYDTRSYVLMDVSGVSFQGQACRTVPMRKADGALFCLTERIFREPIGPDMGVRLTPVVQTDASGDLIFVTTELASGSSSLSRLDMRDPSRAKETRYPDVVDVVRLVVNAHGDVLVASSTSSGGASLKLYPAAAEVQHLSGQPTQCHTLGVLGEDTTFYYSGPNQIGIEGIYALHRQENGSFVESLYSASMTSLIGCYSFARTSTRHYVRSRSGANYTEFLNPSRTLVRHEIPGTDLGTPWMAPIYNGALVWDSGRILRHHFEPESTETLLAPGEYNLSSLASTPAGDVTFSGTRLSDGREILGSYGPVGLKVEIIPDGTPRVFQILRIR